MESLDREIITWLNSFARRSEGLDHILSVVAINDLFKGVVVMVVLWGVWFAGGTEAEIRRRRISLMSLVVAVVVGLAINRVLASILPHRVRPLNDPELEFTLPFGTSRGAFSNLSAFPSDHAVMFVGLAAGSFWALRSAGLALLGHALIVVLIPRLYLGLHYPSDMVVGAALGLLFAWISQRSGPLRFFAGWPLRWSERHPASFYPLMFLVSYMLSTLFDAAVQIGWLVLQLLGHTDRL